MDREQNERRITAAVSAMQTVLEDQQGDLPDRYVEWIDLYELADAAIIAADEQEKHTVTTSEQLAARRMYLKKSFGDRSC
jgi:hypothetical protein